MCRFEDLLAPAPDALVDGPFGSALKSADYTVKGCRVIRLNNVGAGRFLDTDKAFIDIRRFPALRRHEARARELVTAALGDPLGRTCLVPDDIGPAIVKADCFRSRLHDRISPELITLWLNSSALSRYFADNGKGVGRIRITLAALRNAVLPLPPEAEQRALATRLDALIGRTRTAKTEAERALAASRALKLSGLRAGVTGRLTTRWREANPASESVDDLLIRVPAPQQGRGGRQATDRTMAGLAGISVSNPKTELPQGWRWTPLLRLARQETGQTPSRRHPEYWNGDIGWLGIRDARKHHGTVIQETAQKISDSGLGASSARILPAQTVCLSRTASVGYVTMLGRPMATSQDFVTWTCSPALLPDYLMYALMAEGKGIRRFGHGSTHTTIYFPELRALHIALPPLDEQRAIIMRIKRLLHHADVLAAEANKARHVADELAARSITHAMIGALKAAGEPGLTAKSLLAAIAADREAATAALKSTRKQKRDAKARTPRGRIEMDALMTAAELTATIRAAGGSLRADVLWKRSGLPIEEFYRALRDEIAAGRIEETPDKESLLAH